MYNDICMFHIEEDVNSSIKTVKPCFLGLKLSVLLLLGAWVGKSNRSWKSPRGAGRTNR